MMPDSRTVDRSCRVCGAGGSHCLHTAREMMFGLRHPFDYFECCACGCLQLLDFPNDISPYYPEKYYAHSGSPEQQFAHPVRAFFLRARTRYAVFGRDLPGKLAALKKPEPGAESLRPLSLTREASILDVGCGSGLRLYTLREIGFKDLLGVDPHIQSDHTYGNGLRIEKAPLDEVSGSWDVIMFHHSFEHIANPLETLRQVRRLLKSAGHCVIRIPTASSYAWRHYGTDWVQLDAPRHYFLHSRASIKHLAEQAGLRVTQVRDDSTDFQFLGSELYRRNISLEDSSRHARLFTPKEINEFKRRAKQLNSAGEGDSAAFYLNVG